MKNIFIFFLFILFSFSSITAQHTARHFDGYSYFNIPDDPALRITNNLTFEAWVFLDDAGNNTIIDKGDYNYLFQTHSNSNSGLGLYSRSFGWIYSAGTVFINTWAHVAVVFQTGTDGVKFYLNGELLSSHTMNTPLASDSGPVNIGRQSPYSCACNLFNGDMDDLKIWNTVRTQAEIVTDMNNSTINNTGLVAHFPFDENGGTTVSSTIGSFTGTLFIIPPPPPPKIIEASAGPNGRIVPSGEVTRLPRGGFRIYPDPGYQIVDVIVDGVSVGAVDRYIFRELGHTISATFGMPPIDMKLAAMDILIPYLNDTDKKIRKDVEQAIENIDKSLDPVLWLDEYHLDAKHGNKVFDEEKYAVKKLTDKKFIEPFSVDALKAINLLVSADQSIVQIVIDEVVCDGDPKCEKELESANDEMVKASAEQNKNNFDNAIDHYKKAWQHAQQAMKKSVDPSNEILAKDKESILIDNSTDTPVSFSLDQNYPNPFNPTTKISFAIPESGYYTLKVYNTLGQEVATLFNGQLGSGNYSFSFDASKLSTGIYIYTIRGNSLNISKKMILMK